VNVGLQSLHLSGMRHRSSVPDEREPKKGRVSAFEKSLKSYADNKSNVVINPAVGVSFDSHADAYDFCNLYSWEVAFGIRWNDSTNNAEESVMVQEIVCSCEASRYVQLMVPSVCIIQYIDSG
jgi:hypothetical protein